MEVLLIFLAKFANIHWNLLKAFQLKLVFVDQLDDFHYLLLLNFLVLNLFVGLTQQWELEVLFKLTNQIVQGFFLFGTDIAYLAPFFFLLIKPIQCFFQVIYVFRTKAVVMGEALFGSGGSLEGFIVVLYLK